MGDKANTSPPTNEDMQWAAGLLQQFREARGFPDPTTHLAAFKAHVAAFLRIVWHRKISEIIERDDGWKRLKRDDPDTWSLAVQRTNKAIPGDPIDGEWLISIALDRFDHYPLPIELREIYREFLPPRDGKEWFRSK